MMRDATYLKAFTDVNARTPMKGQARRRIDTVCVPLASAAVLVSKLWASCMHAWPCLYSTYRPSVLL